MRCRLPASSINLETRLFLSPPRPDNWDKEVLIHIRTKSVSRCRTSNYSQLLREHSKITQTVRDHSKNIHFTCWAHPCLQRCFCYFSKSSIQEMEQVTPKSTYLFWWDREWFWKWVSHCLQKWNLLQLISKLCHSIFQSRLLYIHPLGQSSSTVDNATINFASVKPSIKVKTWHST